MRIYVGEDYKGMSRKSSKYHFSSDYFKAG